MEDLKVSFCTTCMNRLHHLKHTLVKNILDNKNYQNLEFILLDYNSSDGLYEYAKRNFSSFIDSGILTYYRTDQPSGYNMSHSRNMVFKLATGNIVCNIDADNFTGLGFASYVNQSFAKHDGVFLTTHNISGVKNDVLGRICVKKEDFLAINGYDERMLHYGFDDIDFANRLEAIGLCKIQIDSPHFLSAIEHSNSERMNNYTQGKGYQKLFIRYINACESELVLLFDEQKYVRARIVNNYYYNIINAHFTEKRNTRFRFSILEPNWEEGSWKKQGKTVVFSEKAVPRLILHLKSNKKYLSEANDEYYLVSSGQVMETVLFFYNQVCNRIIMEENSIANNNVVNQESFGKGLITKNFEKEPIAL